MKQMSFSFQIHRIAELVAVDIFVPALSDLRLYCQNCSPIPTTVPFSNNTSHFLMYIFTVVEREAAVAAEGAGDRDKDVHNITWSK